MNELKVGLLSLFAIGAIIFMSLRVTSNQSGFGKHAQYRTILDDASGIFPKTPIKVAGITAGRIKSIDLDGSRALITFEVQDEIKLSENSILRVKSVGFLGDKYLDIYVGKPGAPLPLNAFLRNSSGGGLDDIAKDASDILGDVKVVMKSIRETISPEGQETPLKAIMKDIQEISENTKAITATLRKVMSGNEDKINKTIANLEKISSSLEYELNNDNPDALLADVKKIGPILDDAKKTMGDVSAIVGDVRKGKGTVGKLLRDEEVIDQVTETLAGVNRIVNRVNMMQTELSMFTQVGSATDQATMINLDLNTSPERFYRFGIVSSEFGVRKEKEIQTQKDGGATSIENRTEFYKNSYRFNFQLGRKWDDFALRAGLIETTGGFGVDYFPQREGTRFTFEVFDYRKSIGPNVRFVTEFHIWNVLYLRLAAEDLVGKNQKQNYAAGGGLRFTDDDIGRLLAFVF
ncbi:MAG: MlaD family protein [Bacteriovoracaceae bacterium]